MKPSRECGVPVLLRAPRWYRPCPHAFPSHFPGALGSSSSSHFKFCLLLIPEDEIMVFKNLFPWVFVVLRHTFSI